MLDIQNMLEGQGPSCGGHCPEDVFLAWALSLPMDVDIAAAAQQELTRLDATEHSSKPVRRLRALLVEATAFDPKRPLGRPGHC